MKSGLKRALAFLLTLTIISLSALNMFLGKYALTFSVTDSLSVAFYRETVVNLPRGREMNTLFNPSTEKIVFGATVADLPQTAKLIDPSTIMTPDVPGGYTMVSGGQTNSPLEYVSGVTPATFDPADDATYGAYRINDAFDDTGLFAFYDETEKTTYLVSRTNAVSYHFHEESAKHPSDHSSTDEYNDFFCGLSNLTDIELKTGAAWDTSDVQTFENFLKGCSSIDNTELAQILSWIDPTSAYSLSGMFSGMTDVTTVNLSGLNLSRAAGVDISYMLSDMTDLTTVYFPTGANKIQLLADDGMKGLFSGDSSLVYLDISALPYGVTTNDTEAFKNCSLLQTIVVAQDFVHSTVEPTESIFEGCTALVGQNGTAFADEYLTDATAAVGKNFAYVDGKPIEGVPHKGYYSDGSTIYTLTFNPSGGTSGATTSLSAVAGANVLIPASAETTRGLDTFIGWSLSSTADTVDYETLDTILLSNNTTLYAVYEVTVHLDVGENLKTLIDGDTKHIVYCLETEVPDPGNLLFKGNADLGGAGDIKVYYDSSTYTTYIASTVPANHVVFEFNVNSEELYADKGELLTISHTDTTRIDTSRVQRFRNMFYNCSKLQQDSLNAFLAEFDTSSAIQFNAMFNNVKVSYLDISSFDTSNATDFSWMFENMTNLTEINFGPGWNVSKADSNNLNPNPSSSGHERCGFHAMFTGCSSLEELDLSGWELNTNSLVYATDMFRDCKKLKTIYTDGSFDLNRIGADSNMFLNCNVLEGGLGTKYSVAGVKDKSYAKLDAAGSPGYFTDVVEKTKVTITFDANGGTSGTLDYAREQIGTTLTITADYTPTAPAGYTFLGWGTTPGGAVAYNVGDTMTITGDTTLYAIYQNNNVITSATLKIGTEIKALINNSTTDIVFGKLSDLPAGVTFKGNADANNNGDIKAYYKNGTTYFIIDSAEPSVTINFNANCEEMFYEKANLERISHTSGVAIDTSNVTTFKRMFNRCANINETSLNAFIAEFDTSSATNLSSMLGRTNVTSIDISNFNTSNVTNFSYMFDWSPNLLSVTTGPGWNVSKASILLKMFDHCTAIQTIDLSGWTLRASGNVNADFMFGSCTSLTTIYSDGSFDASKISTGSNMFQNEITGSTMSLVGGAGTVWSSSNKGKSYAHIDAAGDPGYFTQAPTRSRALLAPVSPRQKQIMQLYDVLSNLSAEDAEKLEALYPGLDIEALDALSDEDLEILVKQFLPEEEDKKEDGLSELRKALENLSKEDTEKLYEMYPDLDLEALDKLSDEDIEKLKAEFAPEDASKGAEKEDKEEPKEDNKGSEEAPLDKEQAAETAPEDNKEKTDESAPADGQGTEENTEDITDNTEQGTEEETGKDEDIPEDITGNAETPDENAAEAGDAAESTKAPEEQKQDEGGAETPDASLPTPQNGASEQSESTSSGGGNGSGGSSGGEGDDSTEGES